MKGEPYLALLRQLLGWFLGSRGFAPDVSAASLAYAALRHSACPGMTDSSAWRNVPWGSPGGRGAGGRVVPCGEGTGTGFGSWEWRFQVRGGSCRCRDFLSSADTFRPGYGGQQHPLGTV